MKLALLRKDIEKVRARYPDRKLGIDHERLEEILTSGVAAGYEWSILTYYLGKYLFQIKTRYKINLNSYGERS